MIRSVSETLQESGAALAEYAKQAARTVVLQQTAKVKAVLEQALKHAEKLSAASPSALGMYSYINLKSSFVQPNQVKKEPLFLLLVIPLFVTSTLQPTKYCPLNG